LVVSTHPDTDHSYGLHVVLESLAVGQLWMHKPWEHGIAARKYDEQLEASIAAARELAALATRKGVRIVEPFAGVTSSDAGLRVLGPSREFYVQLLSRLEDASASQQRSLMERFGALYKTAADRIRELWHHESLAEPEPDATRQQNNSSVILLAALDNKRCLFTADAGVLALDQAIPALATFAPGGIDYFQLPHHGSKRNIGPTLLDRILGPRVHEGATTGKTAFISAAADGKPKHPSQRVVNAANRRGAKVIATSGSDLRLLSPDAPPRGGWGPVAELPFTGEFED